MPERTLDYMPVGQLIPNPDNVKRHDVDELLDSISRFGFVEPCVIDERTGLLLSGHGRVETLVAAVLAKLDAPDGVQLDDEGQWTVPVVRGVSSRDDDEALALTIALNGVGEGLWHDEGLSGALERLRASEGGLTGIGATDGRLAELLDSVKQDEQRKSESVFAEFGEQNRPDAVDFRFGDYSGKLARPLYARFVEVVEKQREQSGDVLLDDVLTSWLSL